MPKNKKIKVSEPANSVEPGFSAYGISVDRTDDTSRSRRERANDFLNGTQTANKYPFINELPLPWISINSGAGSVTNYLSIYDTLLLIEKAYFGFSLYRNVVETFVELSNTDINLTKGNKQSRDFINKWLERIGIWNLTDQWFRDYFWKANVYTFRLDAELADTDIKELQKIYGTTAAKKAKKTKEIPIEYLFLAPESIVRAQYYSYSGEFYRKLSPNDIQRIKNPKNDEDEQFAKSLSKDELKQINLGSLTYIKIDPTRLYYSSYKRQSYYPFGVPFGYSVLADIDYKLLLNKLDTEIAKTLDLALLHIKVGDEKGIVPINYNNIKIIQDLFSSAKLSRIFVSDCFVDMAWKIPDVKELLGPEKHAEINRRLKEGLFASLFSENEKFASLSIKMRTFVEKLNEARKAFLTDFLQKEIKRVCQVMNFKDYPRAKFTDISLEDEATLRKIYARFFELGALTPEQVFKAVQDGILPNDDEIEEQQTIYKKQRDKGLFTPLLNQKQDPSATGRPVGSQSPKTKLTTKPIGSKASYSFNSIYEKTKELTKLEEQVSNHLCKSLKVKELDESSSRSARYLSFAIAVNEDKKNWNKSIESYIKNTPEYNTEAKEEIIEIENEYNLSNEAATVLYLSQKYDV